MLLVDDDQPQVGEAHPVLDERMGSHQQLHLARGDPFECGAAFAGLRRTREDRHPHGQPVEQARERGVVLPRQNLGGSHHAGLKTVVDGQQHRQQRHERLARPHVALQQPVHLAARHRILPDFAHDALLRPRKRKGQLLPVKRIERLPHAGEIETVVSGQTLRTARHHVELHAKQLLEFEAVLRLPERFRRLGEMDVVERFAQGRQSVLSAHLGRQRLADALARDPPRIAHDRMEPFGSQHRRQPLGRGVDPLQTALGTPRQRLFDGLYFGMHQREFVAEERRAAEDEVFAPHFDALLDPLDPLEPHQLGLSRGIRDIGREASFASCVGIGHAGDATPELDERLPRSADFGDPVDLRAVDIAEREMVKQIAHGRYAQLLVEQFGPCLADAGDVFHVVRIPVSHRCVTIR